MGKSVLITGTSSGIGLASVERFVDAGFDVVATVRKQADERTLADRFAGIDILNVELDDARAIDSTIGSYLERRGGVDVVVNNAGFACIGPVEEVSMDKWRAQMETNFFAVVQITRLALPYMRKAGHGRIIQVSSGAGKSVIPIFAPYCASKHALEAFSEALRYEVAQFGIGVSLVAPGPVASKFGSNRRVPSTDELAQSAYQKIYAAMYRRTEKAHENESSAADVVDKIFAAATVNKPALRYEVGWLGRAASLSSLVPKRLLEMSMNVVAK